MNLIVGLAGQSPLSQTSQAAPLHESSHTQLLNRKLTSRLKNSLRSTSSPSHNVRGSKRSRTRLSQDTPGSSKCTRRSLRRTRIHLQIPYSVDYCNSLSP
ncbi:hypothetical protein L596_027956 [Steinernema carpocapsae]|uniref:Uncharacterized protein n=1 Tax=Steinernema carpocapsae TaxID=34508 RepID=A0A4U5LX38_STECR|nr:hypothetical protein L596_027956 [Steinernema carpocapsae]